MLWSINSVGLKLNKYYKDKENNYWLKESNNAFFSSFFEAKVEGKTLGM